MVDHKNLFNTPSHLATILSHTIYTCNHSYPLLYKNKKRDLISLLIIEIILYFYFLGLISGNICNSRIGLSARKANNLSPKPKPHVGGMPYSSISINS